MFHCPATLRDGGPDDLRECDQQAGADFPCPAIIRPRSSSRAANPYRKRHSPFLDQRPLLAAPLFPPVLAQVPGPGPAKKSPMASCGSPRHARITPRTGAGSAFGALAPKRQNISQSDKIAQEMGREVEHIAAAVAELGDNLQDKPALVALIEKVDSLNKMAVAHGANPLSCLASWWDKILTATLLDQIADSPAVPGLMSDMLERAALIVRNTSEGGEEEPSRVNGLAERAAELLGLSAEIAAFSKGEASDPGGPAAEIGEGAEASGRETSAAASGPMDEPAAGQSEAAEQEGDLAPEMLDFSGTMFDDSLIYDFIDECESHLDDIEPKILTLEENMNNLALVDEIFRPVHSIKGGSGFLQIHAVTNFSHEAENLLDAVRKKRLPVTPYLCETLLGVMDVLKTMLSQLRTMADRALGSDKSAGLLPARPGEAHARRHPRQPGGEGACRRGARRFTGQIQAGRAAHRGGRPLG